MKVIPNSTVGAEIRGVAGLALLAGDGFQLMEQAQFGLEAGAVLVDQMDEVVPRHGAVAGAVAVDAAIACQASRSGSNTRRASSRP